MAELGSLGVTTEVTNELIGSTTGLGEVSALTVACTLNYVAASATELDVFIQTTLDGSTWWDIMQFHFTTAGGTKMGCVSGVVGVNPTALTSGTMSDNTRQDGIIGDAIRAVCTSSGDYGAGTEVSVEYAVR